ncbi:MAG: RNA polymerase sigma factor RpoD/SigA [Calditrichaeota bacterium]|nr:RNA polymerase sigma factor RpoD/SigA [Calditrichota bacterium]
MQTSERRREGRSLDIYLSEIGEHDLITPDEEIELAKRIKKGDKRALEKLTKSNLRFVVSVAKQYQNQGMSLGDLINEGNIGLIKAALRFDETRGFKFISYAVWWIKQSILQSLAEHSRAVRLPLNRVGTLSKISRVYNQIEQKKGRQPIEYEIAKELDLNVEEVIQTLKVSGRHLSIDQSFTPDEDNRLLDVLKNQDYDTDEHLIDESLKEDVDEALEGLTQREAEVIRLYFGLNRERPMTLEEIGSIFQLTRERVRQIKEKAIKRLRHSKRSLILKSYLG